VLRPLRSAAKSVPPIKGLVNQRDSLRRRLKRTKADLKRVRNERQSLRTSLDQAQARVAHLEEIERANTTMVAALANDLSYGHDGMLNYGKNMTWLHDERFMQAYLAGMDSGHHIARAPGSKDDIHIEWRVHVLIWAAQHALHLDGDFVECGVNTGIFSLAICHYLDFNKVDKSFYLFDTFDGLPESQMLPSERERILRTAEADLYSECFDVARRNFAPFERAVLVRGTVPDTLEQVSIDKVAFLSIDMNLVYPEIAAIEHFWDKLVSGGIVVLDDYGWEVLAEQQRGWDEFAAGKGVAIATLPTGQGLLIKP
jgi:O-methyltransferase